MKVDQGWRVYDTFRGSYPYQMPVLGLVAQDLPTLADAQKEAERLNALGLNTEKHWREARGHVHGSGGDRE